MIYGNLIKGIPKCLLLGADETMIDTVKKGKVIAEGIHSYDHFKGTSYMSK